jgi:hypothetical protein
MNKTLRNSLLGLSGLLLSGAALAEGTDPCKIDTNVRKDGTVELSNIEHAKKCEVAPTPRIGTAAAAPEPAHAVVTAPPRATAVAASASNTSTAAPPADTPPATSSDQKDRREVYHDAMLAGESGTTAANPSVSRRYKMMDKATYQAKVLNGAAPVDSGGSTSP